MGSNARIYGRTEPTLDVPRRPHTATTSFPVARTRTIISRACVLIITARNPPARAAAGYIVQDPTPRRRSIQDNCDVCATTHMPVVRPEACQRRLYATRIVRVCHCAYRRKTNQWTRKNDIWLDGVGHAKMTAKKPGRPGSLVRSLGYTYTHRCIHLHRTCRRNPERIRSTM